MRPSLDGQQKCKTCKGRGTIEIVDCARLFTTADKNRHAIEDRCPACDGTGVERLPPGMYLTKG